MTSWHSLHRILIVVAALAVPAIIPPVQAVGAVEVSRVEPPDTPAVRTPDIIVAVTMKSGFFKTTPVDNLDVFLCPAAAAREIEEVRATGRLLAKQIGNFRGLASDLPFMKGRAKAHLQQKSTTDAAGVCVFKKVPPGEYVVFAGYSDASGAGYWIVPVAVESGTPQRLELTTKRLNEFFKKP